MNVLESLSMLEEEQQADDKTLIQSILPDIPHPPLGPYDQSVSHPHDPHGPFGPYGPYDDPHDPEPLGPYYLVEQGAIG